MADTKEEKGKKKKTPEDSGLDSQNKEDDKKKSANKDDNKAKKKTDVEQKLALDKKALGTAPNEGTFSSLAQEYKETNTQTQDVSKNESGEKNKNEIDRPLKWHPDEIHCRQLCLNCLKINYYWPPRLRPPTPPDKDPNLTYPGDVDPNFTPCRGDILMVHPRGLGLDKKPSPEEWWWKSKRIGGGFCITYDGDKKFTFEEGDLVLRIGTCIEGVIEAELEGAENIKEVESKSKQRKKTSKTPKIADPPQLDPVTYKPYDRVELYSCTGFEIIKEEALEVDSLEVELRQVVKANTNYDFSMLKNGHQSDNKNAPRKSWKDEIPILNANANHNPLPKVDKINNLETKRASQKRTSLNNEVKSESSVNVDSKSASRVQNIAQTFVESRNLEKSKNGQKDVASVGVDSNLGGAKDDQKHKIKLIWTFLGSQSLLPVGDNVPPATNPKCPGLGCFYIPYLNLGNHCKMEDHNHAPILGDILIPEGAWFKRFDHRKNEWRSMVEWYVPDEAPLQSSPEGIANPTDNLDQEGENSNSELDKGRKKSVKEKGQNNKDKEGAGEKNGKRKSSNQDEKKLSLKTSNKEENKGQPQLPGKMGKEGKGNETLSPDDLSQDKADKAIQVPQDLEEPEKKEVDSIMPTKKELTVGTILIRPLVGRKLEDEQTPIEEWKWPRKYKVWGSVEMYMVEPRIEPQSEQGPPNLDWVYWGKSGRICDTPHPQPPTGAKLKFMHPKDAKVEVPGVGKDIGKEPPLVKEDTKVDNGLGKEGTNAASEDANKQKKRKRTEK